MDVYAPDRIRTCDLRIRSPLLYPAELQAHKNFWIPYAVGDVYKKYMLGTTRFVFIMTFKNRILSRVARSKMGRGS